MKTLTYTTTINKPVEHVFNKMTDPSIFADWAKAWGEGMTFSGEYKVGEHLCFFDESGRGTKAVVEELIPNETIKMKHIAMVENQDQEIEVMDETMQKWIGALEEYYFIPDGEKETTLKVVIVADEAFEPMMQAWNKALVYFKEICEEK